MSGRDYDEVLRRALHAAAESVEPSSDGLERIRARLGRPPLLSFATAVGWYSETSLRIAGWAEPLLGSLVDAFRKAVDRFRPPAAGPGNARPRFGWLRPVAAMATFIFVVAAGAAAAMTIPQAISSSSSSRHQPSQSGQGGGGSGQQQATNGASQFPSGSGAPASTPSQSASSPAATKCHEVSSSPPVSTSPNPGGSSTSPAPPTSSSPAPPTSSSPAPPTSTSPAPTTSDTTPSQPGSSGTSSPGVTTPSTSLGATSPQSSSQVQSVQPSASLGSAGSSLGSAGSSSPASFTIPCLTPAPSTSTAKTAKSLSGTLAPVLTFGHGLAGRVPPADRTRKNA